MKGWAVAAILAVLLVGQWWRGEQKDTVGVAALRLAAEQHGITKARLAEALIDAAEKDTVYRDIRVRVPSPPVVLTDTQVVRTYITLADSALNACDELSLSCAEARAATEAQLSASQTLIGMHERRAKELERKIELGPRFESGIGVDRSLVVGDIRVSARGDVRLLGRIHGYVRAEHTFGYPPRSDLRVGIEARP